MRSSTDWQPARKPKAAARKKVVRRRRFMRYVTAES
jgi:hypothetical protein